MGIAPYKLLNIEQMYASARGDEAEVQRLARKKYPARAPQPPDQVPPPMIWWPAIPGRAPAELLSIERSKERFFRLTGKELDMEKVMAVWRKKGWSG